MSSGKIRLVNCPNCWSVLPESVDVPVYRCGGCGKILQAKYRQQQKDAEKSVGDDVVNKSSCNDLNNLEHDSDLQLVEDEHNGHGVGETAAEENSHEQGGQVEQEKINDPIDEQPEESQQTEERDPPFFKRIMSASTEYHDPCSTFEDTLSETCNSPQNIHQFGYDASVSSFNTQFLSRQRRSRKNGVFLADDSANGVQFKRSFNLPPRPRYQSSAYEDDKIKLLKMVYELEEQLKKTCNFVEHPQRQQWNHHDRYLRSSSRIPFSAEVARVGHQFRVPCDRQYSEPLPSPPYKKMIRNPYSSWSSSPMKQVDSYLSPWMSPWKEDSIYGFQKMKMKKKHLRPIAGAAPFLACQNCSQCLQLPQDFLLSKGRCHRVRCGSCSTVMRFSLENRTCIVPSYYEEDEEEGEEEDFRAPPPSEVDEYSMNSTSSSKGKMVYSDMPHPKGPSPLHNLMGYSTVSQVFKVSRASSNTNGASSSMPKR